MNGVVLLVLLLIAGRTAAQQQDGYLMLVDAENRMPFTARIVETLVQSSDHGHLLFPRLADSSYQVIISFPRRNLPEQVFPVVMHKRDQGMLLKGSDSTWTLYNWQSKETIRPLKNPDSTLFLEKGVRREDGFSRLMAAVVNDSSVMYNIYGKRPLSPDRAVLAKKKDTLSSLKMVKNGKKGKKPVDSLKAAIPPVENLAVTPPQGKDTVVVASAVRPENSGSGGTSVRKLREVSLKVSRKIVYLVADQNGVNDTVTCFLFFDRDSSAITAATTKAEADSLALLAKTARKARLDSLKAVRSRQRSDSLSLVKSNLHTADSLKSARAAAKAHKPPADSAVIVKTPEKPVAAPMAAKPDSAAMAQENMPPVPACTQSASDNDLSSLRSTILGVNSVQDKLSIIYGALAIKCFSAAQLRTLAELFVSDKARYRLFEMGSGHVSDPQHFTGLEDLLTDKVYIRKFKTLTDRKG